MTDAQEHEYATWFVRALDGDAEAYERSLVGLTTVLRAYMRSRTGDVPWVDDVAQPPDR